MNLNDIGGVIVKDNDTYVLKDNTELKNLVLSSTFLKAGQETRGHSHPGQEEVYIFVSGNGSIQVGDANLDVGPGSVVLIPDGAFHKVWNKSNQSALYFVCVFDGKRSH